MNNTHVPSINDLSEAYFYYVRKVENPKYMRKGQRPLSETEILGEFDRAIAQIREQEGQSP